MTYESVLLTTNRNVPIIVPESQKVTSYAQIDLMLERMLSEVEEQEKLFGLDLDLVEDNDVCVNSLVLEPSTDALIEIPIRKRTKTYEASKEIVLDDSNNYEYVNFSGPSKQTDVHDYDLINFEEKQPVSLDALQAEAEECVRLLDSIVDDDYLEKNEYKYPMYFKKAQSESLSDLSNNSDEPCQFDYEPIVSSSNPRDYPYQLYENPDYIWWEGTYRNLSIVPEEDEENLSLLGSIYSNRNYTPKYVTQKSSESENRYSSTTSIKETSNDDCYTDTSKSKSTDDSDYDVADKVVKAEVKILVKTSDRGKDEIEIRSVREFLDNTSRDDTKKKTKESKRVARSQTLPAKLSSKFNNLTNKVSSILANSKKSSQSYSFLSDTNTEFDSKETIPEKPVFTLQRLFIRTPDSETIKTFGNDQTKDKSRSRTELVSAPTNIYPLQYDPSTHTDDVDLYANTPFYPCYDLDSSDTSSLIYSNPFTEPNQAYCDWLSADDHIRGNNAVKYVPVLN